MINRMAQMSAVLVVERGSSGGSSAGGDVGVSLPVVLKDLPVDRYMCRSATVRASTLFVNLRSQWNYEETFANYS